MTATARPLSPAGSRTDDYIEFCLFLQRRCGIDLQQYKRPQMERRLRSFYSSRGITDLTETFAELRDPAKLDELLDRITINVSQLWRNPEQWEVIGKLLPDLAADGRLTAWSAGSSYGAEAYTLATLAHLRCPRARIRVRGTDIDARMVARARKGLFTEGDARDAPASGLKVGFDPLPEGGWQVKPQIRQRVCFEVGDLLRMTPPAATYDLVLCRNTVIYFTEPIRDQLHERLAGSLRRDGLLVIGSTERVSHPERIGLVPEHPFIYRRA